MKQMFAMRHVYDLVSALSIVTYDSAPYFRSGSRPNMRRKGKPCLTHTLRILLLVELRSFVLSLISSHAGNPSLKKYTNSVYFIYYFLLTILGIASVAVTCHSIPSAVRSTITMKPVNLAVLLFAVASIVSGAPKESG